MKKYSKAELGLINCLSIIQELYCNAEDGSREEALCLLAKKSIYSALKTFQHVYISDNSQNR